jgi:hypothetical protein
MGWVEVIHDCPVPPLVELTGVEVGSVWECESEEPHCRDHWRLRQKKNTAPNSSGPRPMPDWQRLTVNGQEVPSGTKR